MKPNTKTRRIKKYRTLLFLLILLLLVYCVLYFGRLWVRAYITGEPVRPMGLKEVAIIEGFLGLSFPESTLRVYAFHSGEMYLWFKAEFANSDLSNFMSAKKQWLTPEEAANVRLLENLFHQPSAKLHITWTPWWKPRRERLLRVHVQDSSNTPLSIVIWAQKESGGKCAVYIMVTDTSRKVPDEFRDMLFQGEYFRKSVKFPKKPGQGTRGTSSRGRQVAAAGRDDREKWNCSQHLNQEGEKCT